MELEIDIENDQNYYGSDIDISNQSSINSSSDSSSNISEEEVDASQTSSERTSVSAKQNIHYSKHKAGSDYLK